MQISHDRTLKRELPRERDQLQESAQRQNQALDRAKVAVPAQLEKKRLDLEKLRRSQQELAKKLAQLKKDLAAMTVRSPADGVVYYGRCVRGKWQEVAKMTEQLRPGGMLMVNQPALTIVALRPLQVRLDLAEKDLQHVRPGVRGSVVPAGFSDLRLPAKVAKTSLIPLAPGVFDCELRVEAEQPEARVVPGMSGSVTLIAYDKPQAIAVPTTAIFADADAKDYVYVSKGEGQHEKRAVVVGKRTGEKAEILSGLKEGEEILLQKPSEAKP